MPDSPEFPYRIEAKVGEGAMGSVYRAFDEDLQRPLAVKMLNEPATADPAVREEARRRFLQEARAAAALTHPGVATIYRVGEHVGKPFIAMEWLEGVDLETVLTARAPLQVGEAARLGVELAEALAAAHEAGVVHRDIKPANLVVLSDGRLKVTDFGIARLLGSELVRTQVGSIVATPLYASPEQLQGLAVDGRSDIFSAGVVLYRCLTGRLPFEGRQLEQLATAILFLEPPTPWSLNESIPPALSAAVLKALRKNREVRYQSARDLASDLRRFASPLLSRTPSMSSHSLERETTRPDHAARPSRADTSPVGTAHSSSPGMYRGAAETPPPFPMGGWTLAELPATPSQMVSAAVLSWPGRELGRRDLAGLLHRLLEVPLHTEPLAGGVLVDDRILLLVQGGQLLAALDTVSGVEGDEVVEALPKQASVTLHALPPGFPADCITLLASLLLPRRVRLADLDSSFVNLPALARRLSEERFDGVIRLSRQSETAYFILFRGDTVLKLFSEGWLEVPLEHPWESWVSDIVVKAQVEEKVVRPLLLSFRNRLHDLAFDVEESRESTSSTGPRFLKALRRGGAPLQRRLRSSDPSRDVPAELEADVVYRFLLWALNTLPAELETRAKKDGLKYVTTWLPLVKKVVLHHDLPRPAERESDSFDAVTMDGDDKVLHLAQRVARCHESALTTFVARAKLAKAARIKRGDVGGAFLISPIFEETAVSAYEELTAPEKETGTGWTFGAIEAVTHYEGFVRMGPRRGFHLVLVQETAQGFELLAP